MIISIQYESVNESRSINWLSYTVGYADRRVKKVHMCFYKTPRHLEVETIRLLEHEAKAISEMYQEREAKEELKRK